MALPGAKLPPGKGATGRHRIQDYKYTVQYEEGNKDQVFILLRLGLD